MATTRKDETEALTATEPLTAEIAALRADLTELGAMVRRTAEEISLHLGHNRATLSRAEADR